jgi:hypothetical protein
MPFQAKPPAQVQQQKPTVRQESYGADSPNVATGNNSPVTITTVKIDPAKNPHFHERAPNFTVRLGSISVTASIAQVRGGAFVPFKFDHVVPFRMSMKDDMFLVDANLGGTLGMPTIRITQGGFERPPFGWDRNFDNDALEFVDDQQRPVFQMIYRGSVVQINGVFSIGDYMVVATEEHTLAGRIPAERIAFESPIFKYPSVRYMGERIGK